MEVNEISWDLKDELFYVTTGNGTIQVFSYPTMSLLYTIYAHTSNCFCLEIDPKGRYLATGSADALVSLWDINDYVCVKTFGELEFV